MPIIDPPTLGPTTRPRVVVEATEWANREMLVKHLHDAGYAVVGCAGPEGTNARCALVATGECSAAESADVIVQSMRYTDERNREVLRSIRRSYPDKPIVVEVPTPRAEAFPDDFEGCELVPYPATLDQVSRAVARALDR